MGPLLEQHCRYARKRQLRNIPDHLASGINMLSHAIADNPGTGPQTEEIGPIGPQRANRGWPGALPKIPENWEIAQKLGFGGVWGETGTSKHILGTIQSIWVAGFPSRCWNHFPSKTMFFRLLAVDSWIPTAAGAQPAVAAGGPRWGPPAKSQRSKEHCNQIRQTPSEASTVWGKLPPS